MAKFLTNWLWWVIVIVAVLIIIAVLARAQTVDAWRYWTTPAGAQGGEYDLRYTTNAADTLKPRLGWPKWIDNMQTPGVMGTADSILVGSLLPETIYYFAIWSRNDFGWSEISNIVVDTTGRLPVVPKWITDLR